MDTNSRTARMHRVAARILRWATKMAIERRMIIAWAQRGQDRQMLNAASRFRYARGQYDAAWRGAAYAGFANDPVFRTLIRYDSHQEA